MWRLDCKPTLQHFFSPPQYPVGQEDLFLTGPGLLEGHNRISWKEKVFLQPYALMHQGLQPFIFYFCTNVFQGIFDRLWSEKEAPHAMNVSLFILQGQSQCLFHTISFVLLAIAAVLSFTPTLVNPSVYVGYLDIVPGRFRYVCQYASILIQVFAKRALELKCCALLVQLVKVFGNLC